jgi:Ca2+-binding EF-hand superfamily protein
MKIALTSFAFAALSLTFSACHTSQPDRFAQNDVNHDGKLSREEINHSLVAAIFEARDSNRDQKLTRAEWLVDEDAGQDKLFQQRDANRDGTVTFEEALAYGQTKGVASRIMREADTDHDGAISRDEATAFYGGKEGSPF